MEPETKNEAKPNEFEELAKKLVGVPKKDIKDEEAKAKKQSVSRREKS